MAGHYFLNSAWMGVEIVYSMIILILCFLIFFKTKEMYNLTKHGGIKFFRYAFMFLGLAYAFRLILYIIAMNSSLSCNFCMYGKTFWPITNFIVAYFSTLGIMYLVYSTIWKKIKVKHFLIFSNLIAFFIAIFSFIFRSPLRLSLIQFVLLIFAAIIIIKYHKKSKKKPNTQILYFLVFIFWLLSLIILGPRRFLSFEVKTLFQIVSVGVFVTIYYKVTKWIK